MDGSCAGRRNHGARRGSAARVSGVPDVGPRVGVVASVISAHALQCRAPLRAVPGLPLSCVGGVLRAHIARSDRRGAPMCALRSHEARTARQSGGRRVGVPCAPGRALGGHCVIARVRRRVFARAFSLGSAFCVSYVIRYAKIARACLRIRVVRYTSRKQSSGIRPGQLVRLSSAKTYRPETDVGAISIIVFD